MARVLGSIPLSNTNFHHIQRLVGSGALSSNPPEDTHLSNFQFPFLTLSRKQNKRKPFSQLNPQGGQRKKVLKELSAFIDNNAGGDTIGLLNAFLNTQKAKKDNLQTKMIMENKKIKDLIRLMSEASNNSPGKAQFVSLMRSSGFTMKEVNELGFMCSANTWKSSQVHAEKNYPGSPVKKKSGGRQILSADIKESVQKFMKTKKMSHPAANRTVLVLKNGQKVRTPVRYRDTTITEAHQRWKLMRSKLRKPVTSLSSFRKVTKSIKNLKKPKKETDKCHLCVHGKKISERYLKLKKDEIAASTRAHKRGIKRELQKLKPLYEAYCQHTKEKDHQLEKYNNMKDSLTEGKAVFCIDFKSNCVIGKNSTHEVNRDYYQNSQRSCFGVVMYYVNKKGEIKRHYFDIFSHTVSHSSWFVICALEQVFELKKVRDLNLTEVDFWMDNGPGHFKTKELFGYFFNLRKEKNIKTRWHFFIEYHGKNCCDRRFSQISGMLNTHVKDSSNSVVKTTSDLVNVIKSEQRKTNRIRIQNKKEPIHSTQIKLDIPKVTHKFDLSFENFKDEYYSFSVVLVGGSFELRASYLTDGEVVKKWSRLSLKKVKAKKPKKGNNVPQESEAENVLEKLAEKFSKRITKLSRNRKRQREEESDQGSQRESTQPEAISHPTKRPRLSSEDNQ